MCESDWVIFNNFMPALWNSTWTVLDFDIWITSLDNTLDQLYYHKDGVSVPYIYLVLSE